MKIEDILAQADFKDVVDKLKVDTIKDRTPEEYLKEYKGERSRRTTSVDKRENKSIDIFSDSETNKDGTPKKVDTKTIVVAKIHTNLPKKIVRTANAFLFGGEMKVEANTSDEAFKFFSTVFTDKLKMKSVFAQFARTVMTETKAAMLFFPKVVVGEDNAKEIQIGVKILNSSNSSFYPHFDDYGDMDAFLRLYKAAADDGKEHDFAWVQTATQEITKMQNGGTWTDVSSVKNLAGKITVIYAEQDAPEWDDVAGSMDALEMRLSRLIDTNDYFSEPIMKTYGQTMLPSKNSVGKTLEFDLNVDPETGKSYHGDADYLVWQQSIESTKLEIDELKNEIHSGTSTPDISFENLKDIGNITGIGMKFMFMDAFIKSVEKMEIFGPAVQRSVSVIKALIGNVAQTKYKSGLEANNIKVTFRSILPDDLKEYIDVLKAANGDKPINAIETITALSPFTKDTKEEMNRLNADANAESARSSLIGSVITTPESTN